MPASEQGPLPPPPALGVHRTGRGFWSQHSRGGLSAPDYPYSLVSRELRGIIRGLLAKAAGSLELFFDHCLFTMLQELDKTPGERAPLGGLAPPHLGDPLVPFSCFHMGWVVLFPAGNCADRNTLLEKES